MRFVERFLLFAITVSFAQIFAKKSALDVAYKWSQLEFDYPSEEERLEDIKNGIFIPGKPSPIDVDVFHGLRNITKTFVTVPRFQKGVPATLGTVTKENLNGNPLIKPYPSWSWHRNPELCNSRRIVSVYRIKIDHCGRLWVLDNGRLQNNRVCNPQILAFDLHTNVLVHQYEIPSSQLEDRSLLVTPIVDTRGLLCTNTFVYAADVKSFSIIVHDVQKNTSWKVVDKTFYPYPNFGTFNILGDSFELMDGILGMDLEPYTSGNDRKLFYHSLSSATENWVYTSDLRNKSRFEQNPNSSPEIFHVYEGQRSTQSAAQAIDSNGVLYFGLVSNVTFNCWNTKDEYGTKNFGLIDDNKTNLQFASGVKIVKSRRNKEELWVLTCRFQKIATGSLSPNETNFRILSGSIEDILRITKCKKLKVN